MALKIMFADDHVIFREGLCSLVQREPDLEVVSQVGTGTEAVAQAHEKHPDVIVMDLTMPDMNGIDATRQIVSEIPGSRILALSMETDRRFVVESLKAGALGYLLKDCAFAELVKAIRAVAENETYLPPRIIELIVKDYLRRIPQDDESTYVRLTTREREMLQLIADGNSTKEVAFHMEVSVKTVENQRQMLMKKLDLYSIAQLTKYAVREGLSSLSR
ncbi:MAG TPA: DNA-binding response regulator [Geobacter sp.]|nr:DNA-binding response regulator [Geobacter sp.]